LVFPLVLCAAACGSSSAPTDAGGSAGRDADAGHDVSIDASGDATADTPADGPGGDGADAPIDGGPVVPPLDFTPVFEASFAGGVGVVAVGDFDGDHHVDLAGATKAAPYGLSVLFGRADETFEAPAALAVTGATGAVTSVVVADLDYDGVDDLVVKAGGTGPLVYAGSKTRAFTPKPVDVTALPAPAVPGALLQPALPNGNVLALFDDKKVVALIPDGTGGLVAAPAVDFSAFVAPPLVAVGDFNGDGYTDVAAVQSGQTKVTLATGRANGSFLPPAELPVTLAGPARAVVVADFDGDGRAELIVGEGAAATVDGVDIVSIGVGAPSTALLSIPDDQITAAFAAAAVGARPGRGDDLAVATPQGVSFVGQEIPIEVVPVNLEVDYRTGELVVHSVEPITFPVIPEDETGPDLVVTFVSTPGGPTIVRGLDTGSNAPPCPALDATADVVGDPIVVRTRATATPEGGAAVFFREIFRGICVKGSKAPVGEKTPNSPNARQQAAVRKEIETFFSAIVEEYFSKWKIDRIFNNSELECGQGPNGYTICPAPKNVMPAGDYVVVTMAQLEKIPLADATNLYQYAAVFDADGDATNNFVPLAAYPKDFFKDTDRWYEALYAPGTGWKLKVSTAHGMTITPVTDSFARVVIVDNVLYFVIPRSELPAAKLGYRVTAFRHKGDYGLKEPFDYDANVTPPVDTPLAQ
jgi:hypothetical protein